MFDSEDQAEDPEGDGGGGASPDFALLSTEQAREISQWQQQRRRPGGRFDLPVAGFGSGGVYTLWLASPAVRREVEFRDGKPRVTVIEGMSFDAKLSALRDRVLRGMVPGTNPLHPVIQFELDFLEYCAAVIRANYDVTDADLTFLLRGTLWQVPMVQHLFGGEDFVARLKEVAPDLICRMLPGRPPVDGVPPAESPPAPATPAAPARRGWWRPFRKPWKGPGE